MSIRVNAIAVYCSSSSAVDDVYTEEARRLGRLMAARGIDLVYGGCRLGLMGEVAGAACLHGRRTIGIIPRLIEDKGLGNPCDHEHIVVEDMRTRKATMESRADAFIALPGGLGTLEEILEILTLKQLGYHNKPIVLINTGGFYSPLRNLLAGMVHKHFAKPTTMDLFNIVPDSEGALASIESYDPPQTVSKWFNIAAESSVDLRQRTLPIPDDDPTS